jgi:hypothetical protein
MYEAGTTRKNALENCEHRSKDMPVIFNIHIYFVGKNIDQDLGRQEQKKSTGGPLSVFYYGTQVVKSNIYT